MLDKFVFRKNTSDENVIKEILEKKAYSKNYTDPVWGCYCIY